MHRPKSCNVLRHAPVLRDTQASRHFSNSKTRSCASFQASIEGFKANPFYLKREESKLTASSFTESWSNFVLKPKAFCSLGVNHKPLVPYDPNHARSRLGSCECYTPKKYKNSTAKQLIYGMGSLSNTISSSPKHILKTVYQRDFEAPKRRLKRQLLRPKMFDNNVE